jgi:DNA-binding NarL/FixJ family response regulator
VIVITAYASEKTVFGAIRAGAAAFVLKRASNEEILKVIKNTADGNSMLDPSSVQEAVADIRRSIQEVEATIFDKLTSQEMRVLELIAQGKTNRQIAQALNLSEATANNYTSSIISKLAISNRAEAAAYAIRYRLKDYL